MNFRSGHAPPSIASMFRLPSISSSSVVKMLAKGETLPPQYRDHALTGDLEGTRDCHITPDWLLLYRIENDVLVLTLTRTGSHADLF